VPHLHADPFDESSLRAAVERRTFDAVFAMYGRLRDLAAAFVGLCDRFLSVGGVPVYRGFGWPDSLQPTGMRIPTREDAPRVLAEDNPKVVKMVQTEDVVFASHPTATHFRYPRLYGPDQVVPKEWCIVRRLLDGRRRLIVGDGGLSVSTMAYTLNAAHVLLCALDRPEAAAGCAVNVSDECAVSMRQWITLLAAGLGVDVELVNLPWDLARPMHPQFEGSHDHRVLSVEKLRGELGYRDLLDVHEALPLTARWLADNPLYGTVTEQALRDPFDYEAEDRLIDAWHQARADLMPVVQAADPGYIDRYAPTSVDMHLGIDR
jgi:nucleoside-diphosphate-sugar epimerase